MIEAEQEVSKNLTNIFPPFFLLSLVYFMKRIHRPQYQATRLRRHHRPREERVEATGPRKMYNLDFHKQPSMISINHQVN